jgi:RNA polymerase sigma-70 factor (ECF subfamily)
MRLAALNTDRRPADEPLLVARAQGGDRQAFALLVQRYYDRLYRWLYHLGRDRHAAEDLVQDTFLKALAKLDSFRAGTNFRAWLFRIAYHGFLNRRRAEVRIRRMSPEQVPVVRTNPAATAVSQETLELLARSVARLPHDFRAALLLRVEEGLSFRQVAGVLATTEETARWRVFKARQKLMEIMGPHLNGDEP